MSLGADRLMLVNGQRPRREPRAVSCAGHIDGRAPAVNGNRSFYRFSKFGARFSTKAAMPSFWSAVANMAWKTRRSKRMPSASVVS